MRISFWSERAQELFEWPAASVLGKSIEDFPFVAESDIDAVRRIHGDILLGKEHRSTILCANLRGDGTPIACRWFNAAVRDESSFHVISLVEEVAESTQAQRALAESEERFRSLFDNNPDPIVIFGPDGRVTDVNGAIGRFGAAGRDEIVGQHFTAFVHPDDVEAHRDYFDRALQGETLFYEARARSVEGLSLQVVVTTVPVFRNGKVIEAFSVLRDVSGEREAARRIRDQERALEESERRLHSLFANFPDAVVATTVDGTIVDINDAALRLAGDLESIFGRNIREFVDAAHGESVDVHIHRALQGTTESFSLGARRIDGSLGRELNVTIVPQTAGERVGGLYFVIQDVTQRRAAERRAESASQRLRDLYFIAASPEYSDVRFVATLELGCSTFGMDAGAIVDFTSGEPIIEALHAVSGQPGGFDRQLLEIARATVANTSRNPVVSAHGGFGIDVLANGEPFGAIVFVSRAEHPRPFEENDADLLGMMATLLSSSIERKRVREHLRRVAYYDTLTGLPNRVAVLDRLRDAIEVAQSRLQRIAVLFLDLDRFKDVNETLGYTHGDQLLQLVSERLHRELGDRGTVARLGGDEFLLLVPDCHDPEDVRDLAERLLSSLGEPFLLDDYEQFISTSIGIAVYPEDGGDAQSLVKNADIAMYRAKDRGRNAYFFYNSSLEAPIHMRISQERLLRRALELNEFNVYYQPQLDVRTGKVVAVEALVRWDHPKSGLIEPGHFIPSAEISGLIVPLGDWVLRTAAQQIVKWQPTLGPLRLAVNLSGRQFHQRDLRFQVLSAIRDAGLDPQMLELEITETVAMSDAASTVAILSDLKTAGVRAALDDFGTGYSSLGYLRRFDFDALKIDRSFTAGIGTQHSDETIVRTVIAMAHSLGLEVVAEGVENSVQLAFLREHACELVQGYTVAPAMPAGELEALLLRPDALKRFSNGSTG